MRGGVLLRLLGSRVRFACVVCVGLFLWCVAQFHQPETGFSSLISIGEFLSPAKVTALRNTPHYIYESTTGYDGAYYVQLALYPTLDNPELTKAIDNLPYRAKRILFCWAAWVLGLGQPASVVQAHALLNVVCWLALAVVLFRWFPPSSWENFLRWAAVMFSHGVIMSVRHSLVDAPSLLLIALAMRWLETGRARAGGVTLALAGLGKETSLLAAASLAEIKKTDAQPLTARTVLTRLVALIPTFLLVALPLAAWMTFVRLKFGPAEDPGMGNFTLPFVGYVEKWRAAWGSLRSEDGSGIYWTTFGAVVAIGVQWLFFALRWRPADRWWRVGAAFAVMTVFLSTPVWEGFPGASTRVLLPMTLAFNVLVPRGVRWLPVLLAGNLTVAASVFEFSPPHEFFQLRGDQQLREVVVVKPANGWHGPERHLDSHWRWNSGRGELRVANNSAQPILLAIQGEVAAAGDTRKVRVTVGEKMVWSEDVGSSWHPMRFGVTLPPGETVLVFSTDQPAEKVGSDPRQLAFQVANLEMVVRAAPVSP